MTTEAVVNPLSSLAGYRLRRVSASAMDELAQSLERLDLRPTEASILVLVRANAPIRPSEVGRILAVQRANMTPLVASLERRGFLEKAPIDGRSFGLNLTLKGESACAAATQIMQDHDVRLLQNLSSAEAKQLAIILAKLWTTPTGEAL